MYDFDTIVERTRDDGLKWNYYQNSMPHAPADALPLWVADMDFAVAPEIIDALMTRLKHPVFGYTVTLEAAYTNAVCGWFQRRHDWSIQPSHIGYAPGVVPALGFLLDCLTQPGDGVVIQQPVYGPFMRTIRQRGRVIVNNTLINEGGRYRMNFEALDEQLSRPEVKGMILCNPHNPVGRVWQRDELERLVALAVRHDKWIISDEIHCDLVRLNQQYTPLLCCAPEEAERIIVCTAPSKTFNLAGMQISNVIIPNDRWRATWQVLVDEHLGIGSATIFAKTAMIAAYTEGDAWLDALRIYLDDNIRFVEAYCRTHLPHVVVSPCEGTYLMWLDLRAYGLDATTLAKHIQGVGRLALNEGVWFGAEGAGFERLNVACPRSILQEAMQRLQHALTTIV